MTHATIRRLSRVASEVVAPHAFEPAYDNARRAGCFRQLSRGDHRWYCGELSTHPVHQVNGARA